MNKAFILLRNLCGILIFFFWTNGQASIHKSVFTNCTSSRIVLPSNSIFPYLSNDDKFNVTIKNSLSRRSNYNIQNKNQTGYPIIISNRDILIKIYKDTRFEIYSLSDKDIKQNLIAKGTFLFYAATGNPSDMQGFMIESSSIIKKSDSTIYGNGKSLTFSAFSEDSTLSQNYVFIIPKDLDNTIICKATLKNETSHPIAINYYKSFNTVLNAKRFGADSAYKFWSFQGGSYPERYDWIFPLTAKYQRENYQGMNAPDYGGGIPVVDLWTKKQGLAFASIDKKPQLISLPVKVMDSGDVSFAIKDSNKIIINPGQDFTEVPCAIITHHGDYFNALRTYSRILQFENFSFPKAPQDAYQPEWCAWGYERNFNKKQILKSLDQVKRLGFGWVTIDDGWQNADGDWEPNPKKFPGGEKDFISFIDSIHAHGLKVRLWWVPFAAQDSSYSVKHYPDRLNEYGMKIQSKVALEHPDWFLLDKDGNRVQVSWWNSYLLCPALPQVRNYYKDFVRKAILKWGIDGFKIDGQNLNEVPPCYNPLHHHKNAQASSKGVPGLFKEIYETAIKLKPNFLIQACPCGTNFSIYNLPFVNQTVASDPLDSWQVRLKGKTFKALYGNREAYSGDHVELTNRTWNDKLQEFILHGKVDFVSTLAVGGVPASKFTVNGIKQIDSSLILDTAEEKYYKRWLDIYNTEKMSEGTYLNLYDIAYDKPETHVIKKSNTYYYSFFSKGQYKGSVELRGLVKGRYKVYNLYSGKLLVTDLVSDNPFIKIKFDNYMIIKVVKKD
jgi:alpha-galactosidase